MPTQASFPCQEAHGLGQSCWSELMEVCWGQQHVALRWSCREVSVLCLCLTVSRLGSFCFVFQGCVPWFAQELSCSTVRFASGRTSLFNRFCSLSGEEVALYCAKYLPEIIKDQKAYKEGKLQKVSV